MFSCLHFFLIHIQFPPSHLFLTLSSCLPLFSHTFHCLLFYHTCSVVSLFFPTSHTHSVPSLSFSHPFICLHFFLFPPSFSHTHSFLSLFFFPLSFFSSFFP